MFIQILLAQFSIGLHLTQHFQMLSQMTRVDLSLAMDILPQPTWAASNRAPRSRGISVPPQKMSHTQSNPTLLIQGLGRVKTLQNWQGRVEPCVEVAERRHIES